MAADSFRTPTDPTSSLVSGWPDAGQDSVSGARSSDSPAVTIAACEEALRFWMRWNDAYERVTSCMFDARHDQRKLEDMMDQMDQLRRRAIELSQRLLDHAR